MKTNLPITFFPNDVLNPQPTDEEKRILTKIAARKSDQYTAKQLCRAAREGNIWLMKQIYDSGYTNMNAHPYNLFVPNRMTPIEQAAQAGQLNSVLFLIGSGANLGSYCRQGNHLDEMSNAPVIKQDRVVTEPHHVGPLYCALKNGHEKIVNVLIEAGAPIVEEHLILAVQNCLPLQIIARLRHELGDYLPVMMVVNVTEAAKEVGLFSQVSEILKDRIRPQAETLPVPDFKPVPAPSPSLWRKTAEFEITRVEEKPELNKTITDIFNFEMRERSYIIENGKSKAVGLQREYFDDIKSRVALEKACDAFIEQGGKIDKNEVMTIGYQGRNKRSLT